MKRISAILLLLSLSGPVAAVEMCHEQQGEGRLVPCATPSVYITDWNQQVEHPVRMPQKKVCSTGSGHPGEDELCLFMPIPGQ